MLATLLKLAIGAGLLGLLFSRVDTVALAERIAGLDYWAVFAGLVAALPMVFIQAERFRRVGRLQVELNFRPALALTWMGMFFNQTLPSSVGGDAFRIWYMRHHGFNLSQAVMVTLVDRAFGFVALFLTLAAGLPSLFALISDPAPRIAICLLVLAGFVAWLTVAWLDRLLALLPSDWRTLWLAAGLARAASFLRRTTLRPDPALPGFALSLAALLSQAATAWLVAGGLGLPIGFFTILFFTPFANLAALLPVSVGGWGIREAVMIGAFGMAGVSPETALLLSILCGLIALVASLPGLLIWLRLRK